MAFTANLAVALWLILWRRFEDQWVVFTEAADAFARSEAIEEVLTIRRLRRHIKAWRTAVHKLWGTGLVTGLAFALYLYALRWHGADWETGWCSQGILASAAYLSPAVMAVMTLLGFAGKWHIQGQVTELQDLVKSKEQAGAGAFTALLKALANRKR